ncbi:MAG: Flp family type IVb pilin [Janthinobacterium lividum]
MRVLHYLAFRLKAARAMRDTHGVTAIEYALIAALIGVVIIAGATSLGTKVNAKFSNIASSISSAGTK